MRETTALEDRPPGRSRRPLAILAILAVVAMGAVVAAYLVFFTSDAPERFALSGQPGPTSPTTHAAPAPGATTGTGPAAAGAPVTTVAPGSELVGTWRAAAGSEAGYRVREKLVRLPAQSDAVGRSPGVTGSVKVERAGNELVASDASFEVDLTRLASDERNRDNRIRNEGLETNRFPKATFVSTRPIPLPAETASGQAVKATAEGDLTLHGVTRRVTIPIDVQVVGNKGELIGSLRFPMSDFDILPPNVAGVVTVDSDATMEFKLILEKA